MILIHLIFIILNPLLISFRAAVCLLFTLTVSLYSVFHYCCFEQMNKQFTGDHAAMFNVTVWIQRTSPH